MRAQALNQPKMNQYAHELLESSTKKTGAWWIWAIIIYLKRYIIRSYRSLAMRYSNQYTKKCLYIYCWGALYSFYWDWDLEKCGMEHWAYIFGQVVADTSNGMEKSFSTILDHTFLYILGPRVYKNSIYMWRRKCFVWTLMFVG